jgi:hypothetical protein
MARNTHLGVWNWGKVSSIYTQTIAFLMGKRIIYLVVILLNMAIYSGFTYKTCIFFYGYVSLPEGIPWEFGVHHFKTNPFSDNVSEDLLCCPLRSGARGWSPAMHTEIWSVRLGTRQCSLRSGTCGWGPAVPTAIRNIPELAVEIRGCRRRRRRRGRRRRHSDKI